MAGVLKFLEAIVGEIGRKISGERRDGGGTKKSKIRRTNTSSGIGLWEYLFSVGASNLINFSRFPAKIHLKFGKCFYILIYI